MTEKSNSFSFPSWLLHSQLYSLVVVDMEGNYIFVNDCFKNRFSFLEDDFIGKPIRNSVYAGDLEACNTGVVQCLQNPDIPQRVRIRKPSNTAGDFHWTDWEFSPYHTTAGELAGILCIGHDITERKKHEDTIEVQNERLKNIAWQQSHELRSPVVNILGCIQLIRESKELISVQEEDKLFEDIKTELAHLDTIIHKIVSVSKAEK